jgi:hypothetical protein
VARHSTPIVELAAEPATVDCCELAPSDDLLSTRRWCPRIVLFDPLRGDGRPAGMAATSCSAVTSTAAQQRRIGP